MLKLTPSFEASAEKLFASWTEPPLIRQWLFKGDASEIVTEDIDLKRGGRFSIIEQLDDGNIIDHFGTYNRVDRPHFLSFSLEVPDHFCGVSDVQLEFRTVNNNTKMAFQQVGVAPDLVEASWRRMFTQLAHTLLKS